MPICRFLWRCCVMWCNKAVIFNFTAVTKPWSHGAVLCHCLAVPGVAILKHTISWWWCLREVIRRGCWGYSLVTLWVCYSAQVHCGIQFGNHYNKGTKIQRFIETVLFPTMARCTWNVLKQNEIKVAMQCWLSAAFDTIQCLATESCLLICICLEPLYTFFAYSLNINVIVCWGGRNIITGSAPIYVYSLRYLEKVLCMYLCAGKAFYIIGEELLKRHKSGQRWFLKSFNACHAFEIKTLEFCKKMFKSITKFPYSIFWILD